PPSFDLLALSQADGTAVLLGGFTAVEPGGPASPSGEATLRRFDPVAGSGEFLDLPDFDLESGAGAPAGAVRTGSSLGAEGTGSSLVIAGGVSGSGEPRAALVYNPYNAAAAADHDLARAVGPERVLVAATVVGIVGVIER